MKRVLILAYDFPPYGSAGALRPYFWAKYLAEQGHEVTVITRQWDLNFKNHLDYVAPSNSNTSVVEKVENFTCVKSAYAPSWSNQMRLKGKGGIVGKIARIASGLNEIVQFVLPVGPKRTLLKEARTRIAQEQPDLIVATGDPFVLFHYAHKLSKEFGIPWVADYRDPWSQDLTVQKSVILKWWYNRQEKRIVSSALFVTTVSQFLAANLQKILPNQKIELIPNGFDEEIIGRHREQTQKNDVLTLALAGTIYPWNPIESFLGQLSKIIEQHNTPKIAFNLYGINIADKITALIENEFPNLQKVVTIHPRIPYAEMIQHLGKSDVLVLFNYYSSMGTKIYDYIGLQRYILFCYEDDRESLDLKGKHYLAEEFEGVNTRLQEELILAKNAGKVVKDKDALPLVFERLLQEFEQNQNIVSETLNASELSRKGQASKLSTLIEQ